MSRRTIQYAYSIDDGLVYSRVGSEIAFPVLDYDKIEGQEPLVYHLEKADVLSFAGYHWSLLKWTRKIPTYLKDMHREFWGFPALIN